MNLSLQLRLKDGTYVDADLGEKDAGTLLQRLEDEERQATYDDLSLELDNTDGTWGDLFTAANLPPTDAYPTCYGFRVLQDGTPLWEGDLEYSSVEHDEEKCTTRVRVLDGLQRLKRHNAEAFKRDYSGIAIVSGARHSKTLTVNSVLDADGYPLMPDDEIELGHYKHQPSGADKLKDQNMVVTAVDAGANTITFKKKLKANYGPGDAIVVKDPWHRGVTARWALEGLLDMVPGYDSAHRTIDYDDTTWSDILDVANFNSKDVSQAVQLVADWVNAQVNHKVNSLRVIGRGLDMDTAARKNLDNQVGEGSPQPVGAKRYDLIKIKGRDKRWARRGVLPFGGEKLEQEFPFSRNRARLQQVADRYWDYWGRYRGIIAGLPVADDGTGYQVGRKVSLGSVNYKVTQVSQDLDDGADRQLDLLEEGGTLPDPTGYDQDDLVDDDEDPPEPTGFVFTKDYSTTFDALYPEAKWPRTDQIITKDGLTLLRFYEFRRAYPYDELLSLVWRFEVTVWHDGQDRDKPKRMYAVPPVLQSDGYYYHGACLPAGKLWWADVLARLEDMREGIPSDENSSSIEDDHVGTPQYYSAAVNAAMWFDADARPLPTPDVGQVYGADVNVSMWLEARPEGTNKSQRYGADVIASMWLGADARPLPLPDKTHKYGANVSAAMWLEARPEGTNQSHHYGADVAAAMWGQGNSDYSDPSTGTWNIVYASSANDAPATRVKECDFQVTVALSPPAALNASHARVHATRNGAALPAVTIDLDSGSTSFVALWRRCAAAGDDLVVTRIALWQHHRRVIVPSGSLPAAIKAGATSYGSTGKPAAPGAPTIGVVPNSAGPHHLELAVDWAALSNTDALWEILVSVWVADHVLATPSAVTTANVNTGTDVITWNSHGFADGDALKYDPSTGARLKPLVKGGIYYVTASTTNTFKLSKTSGGAAIDLTTAGNNSQTLGRVGAWKEKERVNVRAKVQDGATSTLVKVIVGKVGLDGANNYPNIKVALRDVFDQVGAYAYLYGSSDSAHFTTSTQYTPLSYYQDPQGYIDAGILEANDGADSPLFFNMGNWLVATASKIYNSAWGLWDRPYVLRKRVSDCVAWSSIVAGTQIYKGLAVTSSSKVYVALVDFVKAADTSTDPSGTTGDNTYWHYWTASSNTTWRWLDWDEYRHTFGIPKPETRCGMGFPVFNVGGSDPNYCKLMVYMEARTGGIATSAWATFVADSTSGTSSEGEAPASGSSGSTPDPPLGGGCFSRDTLVMGTLGTGIPMAMLRAEEDFAHQIKGVSPEGKLVDQSVMSVFRGSFTEQMISIEGVKTTADHLWFAGELPKPGRNALISAGRLGAGSLLYGIGKGGGFEPRVLSGPGEAVGEYEPYNLNTETGNFLVSGDGGATWFLVHNAKNTGL